MSLFKTDREQHEQNVRVRANFESDVPRVNETDVPAQGRGVDVLATRWTQTAKR